MISPRHGRSRFTLLLAALALAACDHSPAAAPPTGSLTVPGYAIPTGATATLTVRAANGATRTVAAGDTLAGLAAGTYTITAPDLVASGSTYSPSPRTQTVTVAENFVATAGVVAYAIASARLSIGVAGLPAGASPALTVSGPASFHQTVTATSTMLDRLAPGSYTIAAADVVAGGRTYHATPSTLSLDLAASADATPVAIRYGAGSATLAIAVSGLADGVTAPLTITGPGGYSQTLNATPAGASLGDLEPGTYTIAAATTGRDLVTDTPTPASQTVDVAASTTTTATVSYAAAPLDLGLEVAARGFTAPTLVTAPAGDSRLFVVERDGRILLVKNGVVQATPFLDIRARVNFTGERGLLGVAFDPAYAINGYLYVYYVDAASNLALERISSTPGADVASTDTRYVLSIVHGGAEHHGGTLAFGPDGMLYLGPGDGGCCGDPNNHAQSLNTLLGKILRIDVRAPFYRVPPDNPFVGQTGALGEIWAYGLRNPWRFSFDAPSGTIYIGDVGQDAREEVDAMPATARGVNYGWRLMEGTACYNPQTNCDPSHALTYPVLDYTHAEGCAVVGGFVYRGRAIPELVGRYLYADYCGGWVRSFSLVNGQPTEARTWPNLASTRPVSFGMDGAGELYIVANGVVWRVVRR